MNKVRSDALWTELSPEQVKTLDRWLFDEKLGYVEILPRAQSELGFKGQMSSLKRYFARRQQERTLEHFEDLQEDLADINGAPGNAAALQDASNKLISLYLFRRLQAAPEKVEEWAPLANLMMKKDYNDVVRDANRVRQQTMELAREKFEVDIIEKAMKALPQLKELAEAKKDPQTKRYEQNARWNRVRKLMFGPGLEVQPESAQEEAEMLAAQREREGGGKTDAEAQTGQSTSDPQGDGKNAPAHSGPAAAGEVDQGADDGSRPMITEAGPPGPSSQYYQEYLDAQARRKEAGEEDA